MFSGGSAVVNFQNVVVLRAFMVFKWQLNIPLVIVINFGGIKKVNFHKFRKGDTWIFSLMFTEMAEHDRYLRQLIEFSAGGNHGKQEDVSENFSHYSSEDKPN